MSIRSFACIALCLGAAVAPAARADMQSLSQTLSIGPRDAAFSSFFVFNQFSPSLGTLREVDFLLTTNLVGVASYENTSPTGGANNIALTLQAGVALQRPDGSGLTAATPSTTMSPGPVPIFDGTLDFDGTSGHTYTVAPTPSITNFFNSTSGSDLTLFSGPGTISLPILSVGQSSANGPGNLAIRFKTNTMATATVTYRYDGLSVVPEPSSLALIVGGLGLVGLAANRRRPIGS